MKFQVLVKFQKVLFINVLLKSEIKPVDQKKKNVTWHFSKHKCCPPSSHQPLLPPWGEFRWRQTWYGPLELRCISKEYFQWATLLHLSINRKALKFEMSVVFFLYVWLVIFWHSTTCCCGCFSARTAMYPGSSLISLEQFPKDLWKAGSQAIVFSHASNKT